MKKLFSVIFCSFLFCSSGFSQESEKIDEFSNLQCDEYLARIDNMIVHSQNNPTSTIYVFVYEGKEKKYNNRKKKTEDVFPAFGSAKAKIISMKKYISVVRGFNIKNISFIEAGFREKLTVEVWLVPDSAVSPKPTPTLTKIKYRKGKANGFCLGCCE
jgi:hypothetical protein